MNTKAIESKITKQSKPTKNTFPKIKMDSFFQAAENTNMLVVVETIKKENITK